jgi:hypothetical protein
VTFTRSDRSIDFRDVFSHTFRSNSFHCMCNKLLFQVTVMVTACNAWALLGLRTGI